MTVRRFQLDALPPDIPTDRVDEQRLAVLRELAIRRQPNGRIRSSLPSPAYGGSRLRTWSPAGILLRHEYARGATCSPGFFTLRTSRPARLRRSAPHLRSKRPRLDADRGRVDRRRRNVSVSQDGRDPEPVAEPLRAGLRALDTGHAHDRDDLAVRRRPRKGQSGSRTRRGEALRR